MKPVNPDALGRPSGYSHGMEAPPGARLLFVAGQTGAPGDFTAQFARALDRVLEVVRAAGGRPESVARMTVFVTSAADYRAALEPLGEAWRERMGRHYPAMTLVEVRALVDPEATVEIEATAALEGA